MDARLPGAWGTAVTAACAACGKGRRARLYCRRDSCGLRPAALGDEPDHQRYNAALAQLMPVADWAGELAAAAYAVASVENSPGPRNRLLAIAERASEFAMLVKTARPL